MMSEQNSEVGLYSVGEHLEILRQMLFRIISAVTVLTAIVFYLKNETFHILLAPLHSDFCTFKFLEQWIKNFDRNFHFSEHNIQLISTELSSQFMTHITVSCILGVLITSPYIVMELFNFISPALYKNEKKYSYVVAIVLYTQFIIGLLMNYFIVFPISLQFLATYKVDESITSTITLDSYISTFSTLTFIMGVVFQLPVFAYLLGKMGFIDADLMCKYRAYALIIIMIVSAIITPPDIFTLVLVTIPIYGLYEISILALKRIKL